MMRVERIVEGQDVFRVISFKTVQDEHDQPVRVPAGTFRVTRDQAVEKKADAQRDVVFWNTVIAKMDIIIG